jgi:hypothetical protein
MDQETKISCSYCTHLSRFHLGMETEISILNVMFLNKMKDDG